MHIDQSFYAHGKGGLCEQTTQIVPEQKCWDNSLNIGNIDIILGFQIAGTCQKRY